MNTFTKITCITAFTFLSTTANANELIDTVEQVTTKAITTLVSQQQEDIKQQSQLMLARISEELALLTEKLELDNDDEQGDDNE